MTVRGKTADRIIRAGIIKIMPQKLCCNCGAHSIVILNGNQMYGGYMNLQYHKGLFGNSSTMDIHLFSTDIFCFYAASVVNEDTISIVNNIS